MLVVAKAVIGPGAILNTSVDRPEMAGEGGGVWVARGRKKRDVGVKLGEWKKTSMSRLWRACTQCRSPYGVGV